MISVGDYSPTRSPTIYSSPLDSPSWNEGSNKDPKEDDIPSYLKDKLLLLQEEEERLAEMSNKARDVVLIRNGKKSYGRGKNRKEVLKAINMTVKEGAIYGLLGASGCGKTTLLSCLVGLKGLDNRDGGTLLVFGGEPGDTGVGIPGKRVGYMPQEYALFGEFTILETLQYFGRVYGMSNESVKDRAKFLVKLLDLPTDKSRLVGSFSGGQQRRVSFAATLLHSPDLLILDEPTVGVDPMLRASIWKYLVELTTGKKKTTIMITTHYIDEAKQANAVGLMRNGRLLTENSPSKLLKEHGVSSLEDVFLKLCFADNQNRLNLMSETKKKEKISLFKKKTDKESARDDLINREEKVTRKAAQDIQKEESSKLSQTSADSWALEIGEADSFWAIFQTFFSFGRLWALMMKNFIKMKRSYSLLLFMFALPAVQVIFFCLAIGRDPNNLKIAIVNDEAPYNNLTILLNHNPNITKQLEDTGLAPSNESLVWPSASLNSSYFTYHCPASNSCEFTHLSCRFFWHLTNLSAGNTIHLQPYSLKEDATRAVTDGSAWGVIAVDKNFSASLLDRMFNPLEASEVVRNQSKIKISLDMTNQQVNYVIVRSLMEAYEKFVQGLLISCNMDKETAKMPLDILDPIYGTLIPNFTEFMAPGVIIMISFFLAVALTGEAFISEKRDGLLDRSRVAGVVSVEILVSNILSQFFILAGQSVITLVFILAVFEVPCRGSLGLVILITLLQGCAGMCFGFLLSILCPTEPAAMQATIGSFYPILMLSGILWPVEGMPYYFQAICWYLPCTCACQALRDVMSRGWGVEDKMSVKLGVLSSSAWIGIFLIFSIVALKIQQKVS